MADFFLWVLSLLDAVICESPIQSRLVSRICVLKEVPEVTQVYDKERV